MTPKAYRSEMEITSVRNCVKYDSISATDITTTSNIQVGILKYTISTEFKWICFSESRVQTLNGFLKDR